MGLLNIFKKKEEEAKKTGEPLANKTDQKAVEVKEEKKPAALPKEKALAAVVPKSAVLKQKDKTEKPETKERKLALATKVLIKPVVTEKSADMGVLNQYVFEVASSTNKIEVKKAIASVYKVKPVSVNIVNVSGRDVRYRQSIGRTKDWKKAIVTLKKGDKIEIYHGV